MGLMGFLQRLRSEVALLCATNRVPLSYELTPANVAEVYLTEELLAEARLGDGLARRLFGDLAYRSGDLKEALIECDILLDTERLGRRPGVRRYPALETLVLLRPSRQAISSARGARSYDGPLEPTTRCVIPAFTYSSAAFICSAPLTVIERSISAGSRPTSSHQPSSTPLRCSAL